MRNVLTMPAQVCEAIITHAKAALPNEACGLLVGQDGVVQFFYPLRNADTSPLTFRLDAKEQLCAFRDIDEQNLVLIGIVHSHTNTEAYPSPPDVHQAYFPDAHLVLVSLMDLLNPSLRAYTILSGVIQEQQIRVL